MPDSSQECSPFDDGELYDALFHNLDYAIDFYVNRARQAGGPVLELACGTGRILLPTLLAGVDVDGSDLFDSMLASCRRKAKALGLTPTLYQADMSQFHIPRRYALITITFNAFIHNLSQSSQIQCLESCRRHLLPGGMLVFDTFFPSLSIIGAVEGTRVLECETIHPGTGMPMRLWDTRTFDRVQQIQHSINEIELLDQSGGIQQVYRHTYSTRYVFRQEMELLLKAAGFARWDIRGDFHGAPLTREDQAMIVLAQA